MSLSPPTTSSKSANRHWWQTACIYQIYPASFKDSNGDGFGDLPGISSKIDHLANLGVDAVWLSPCYKSPNADGGYDISDYRKIDPRYGSVADFELLIARLRESNIRLITDLVVNHTSDQHEWFRHSRSSRKNPKRDWQAVYADMRFWLDKGIAGFRMDVINMLAKHPDFPDAPVRDCSSPWQDAQPLYCNQPRVHEYLREMRREVLEHYTEVMSVGELLYTSRDEVKLYVEPCRRELDMAFEFPLCAWNFGPRGRFDKGRDTIQDLKRIVCHTWSGLGSDETAWQTFFLESHDTARSVTRFGDRRPEHSAAVAKMLALLSTTLNGTLFVYQGQEIGMENYTTDVPIEQLDDINTVNALRAIRQRRREAAGSDEVVDMSDVHGEVRLKARDHTRSPMPWNLSKPHADFSTTPGQLWKRMITNTDRIDVASQDQNPGSVLSFWREMINFRKANANFIVYGRFIPMLHTLHEGPVFAYNRFQPAGDLVHEPGILIVLNLTASNDVPYILPGEEDDTYYAIIDTKAQYGVSAQSLEVSPLGGGTVLRLGPYQGLILQIRSKSLS
ncbi:hypothetical protein LTR95_001824 [Oleoguttula sp. CCFEE 5521]